ncbi:hypothetical protein TWF225_004080 [Orbilia oligospora]|uniref:Uncharacterized protein n=1 Tax=Orbilia oligospora TaxID=2813651 RepID=A0A7C8PNL9_ORBOL|nr:hypothetical protein TWF751_004819 [Orbilia oligospora]KAF3187862.1 hypothetical protein TWF225_004080 [Orbilia oligospora]KAF3248137.1 hypothetical protein TWF128_008489 [Orbilia oligospora]KAF3256111.1 hypothetical protein TWF217_006375 [Orbilia oligospora]KAF3284591.1 hypothetical protein TWF132_009740 [Orbilia oligospora]
MFDRFFMGRRVASNANDEEAATNTPIPPPTRTQTAPPGYTTYTPGGRFEFLKDIEAYQAACLINKVVDFPVDDPAPAYDLDDIPNVIPSEPTDDKQIFRAKFQKKLSELKEFLQRRSNLRFTKTTLSDKAMLLICAAILTLIGAFVAVWAAVLHHITLIVTLGILWVATLIKFCLTGWRYYNKRKLLGVINVALLKVDNFERLEDRTVRGIRKGVDRTVPGSYWVDSARMVRMNRTNR